VKETFEIERYILPSEANADRWLRLVREGLTERRDFLFVAESKDRLVGFACVSVFRGHPFEAVKLAGATNGVYVLPECRGKGIGKKLIVECLTKMQTEGVSSVRLTALSGNETAVRLYEEFVLKVGRYGMTKPFKH